jgi:hypothetical protein
MRRCKITVWNHFSGGSVLHPLSKNEKPKAYKVNAWCVGGDTGIFAVFKHKDFPGCTCYAQGDDGHWWFVGRHDAHWTPEYVKAFQAHLGVLPPDS